MDALDETLASLPSRVRLEHALHAALKGAKTERTRAAVVVVEGPSGVGKTHALQNLADQVDVFALEKLGSSEPRTGFVTAVESMVLSTNTRVDVERTAAHHLDILWRYFPALAERDALDRPTDFQRFDPRIERNLFRTRLRQTCDAVFTGRTAVLALDDLQWATPRSLVMLAEILEGQHERPQPWGGLLLAFSSRTPRPTHCKTLRTRSMCSPW
ncbi:MAG: ATP-binding protein, partial [Nannocystaceae bacterium]|nr:ATP-binding protein [Nannocystaceae bacterium]